MSWQIVITIILSAISLAADAFAVSVCDGMVYRGLSKKRYALIPLTFGVFQAVMPIIGFYVGLACLDAIDAFDHWVAFGLLTLIGGKMIFDAIRELCKKDSGEKEEAETEPERFSYASVLVQGVATSIDALAVGFSLNAILEGVTGSVQLWAWISVMIIGVITFIISLVGLLIGIKVGKLFKRKANVVEIAGGVVLLLIAVKIVLSAYGVINF